VTPIAKRLADENLSRVNATSATLTMPIETQTLSITYYRLSANPVSVTAIVTNIGTIFNVEMPGECHPITEYSWNR
jgi:hypothetical protein